MKKTAYFFTVCILSLLTACTSSQRALIPEPPPVTAVPRPVPPPEVAPEESSVLAAVVQRVKQGPGIAKYIVQEGDAILVKSDITPADLEGLDPIGLEEYPRDALFEVLYEVSHARRLDDSRFLVDFSVEEKLTGRMRRDQLLWHIQEDAAGLLLAFDDDYQDAWERYFDVFDKYGAKVTFFLQGTMCPFCSTALNRGHDVGYHTLHHLNLTKVTPEVFFEETLSALDAFRNEGIPLRSFAYPYGLSESWMHEELSKSFTILRGYGVTFRVYDSETIRSGYISSKALDNILYKKDEDFEALVTSMLRTLKFIGGDLILPLTTHDISDTADWGITPRRLEYVLQTAQDLRLRFYRYQDF
ncbi:MAG: polysaccharide deacetylase family protein [Treponema sp.]|jgi:hypothetical protein|nr:polysaccharide deacetylase family protein [Treponema sp.]